MIDIHLFIGDREVEFNSNPHILFNYTAKELSNPTIVRNGWTKSITIDGTPNNDDIFNHFWNLERYQGGGLSFNPMVKTPFTIYYNGTKVEDGYVKLDSVKMKDNKAQYQITLFGSLGQFFYSLSYEGDTNQKKTLASLNFYDEDGSTYPNLDFTITKDTIAEAWHWLQSGSAPAEKDEFNVISFAPVYNGIPQDFDADKVVINNKDLPAGKLQTGASVEGETYRTILNGTTTALKGWSLGELKEELTCDETFDLRSYLQRPVLNVRRAIVACCNPHNNGGYQVKLSSHFFNYDNPFWAGGAVRGPWVTLPLLRDLEVQQGETFEISGATIENTSVNRKNIIFSESLSQLENVRLRLNVGVEFDSTPNESELYTYRNERITGGITLSGHKYVKNFTYNGGSVFQLVGRDAGGSICAYSKAYCLSSDRYNPQDGGVIWQQFHITGYEDPLEVEFIEGKWIKSGSTYYFADNNGNKVDIEFTFAGNTPIATLELITQTNAADRTTYKFSGWDSRDIPNISYIRLWDSENAQQTGLHTKGEVMAQSYTGSFVYNITSFEGIASDYESMFSGTYVPKEKLLSFTDPASFLLSYCKLFDLRFYRDPNETADDPVLCPKGVIHIMDRHTFYTGEVIDIHKDIDRGKEMTITPVNAATKWYRYKLDEVESEVGEVYKNTYGQERPYGSQTISTNYQYDDNITDLYDGNVFKSGIMVREKDKYFYQPVDNIPAYAYNGMVYHLFAEGDDGMDSTELDFNLRLPVYKENINTLGLDGYDLMPKLQLHTDNNEASDGSGVLLFFTGNMIHSDAPYWITDDIDEMITLNDSSPCWILTAGEYDAGGSRIAIETHRLPLFTRDYIHYGIQEGRVVCSWNFGHPQETFVPNVYTTDGDSIYDKCWRDYIGDIFDQNSKKVVCYVRMPSYPSQDALRKFYWFDNSIWALNSVSDWGYEQKDTIKCEFIKVMDAEDYDMQEITYEGDEGIIMEVDSIPCSGGTFPGAVILQSGGGWRTSDDACIYGEDSAGTSYYYCEAISPERGVGDYTPISVTFPENSAGTEITWRISVEDDYDNWLHYYIEQEACPAPEPPSGVYLTSIKLVLPPWFKDIPGSGGTASYDNLLGNPSVIATWSDSTKTDVTPYAQITMEQLDASGNIGDRKYLGPWRGSASYSGKTNGRSAGAYQSASASESTWSVKNELPYEIGGFLARTQSQGDLRTASFNAIPGATSYGYDSMPFDIAGYYTYLKGSQPSGYTFWVNFSNCDLHMEMGSRPDYEGDLAYTPIGCTGSDCREGFLPSLSNEYLIFSTTSGSPVPPTPSGSTWIADNASEYNIYGNLIGGNMTIAGIELSPYENEQMTSELPMEVTEVWLAVYSLTGSPEDYAVRVYNGRTNETIIAEWSPNGNAFIGTGSIHIIENDYINFFVTAANNNRRSAPAEEEEDNTEEGDGE